MSTIEVNTILILAQLIEHRIRIEGTGECFNYAIVLERHVVLYLAPQYGNQFIWYVDDISEPIELPITSNKILYHHRTR